MGKNYVHDYDDYRPLSDFKGCMPAIIVIVVAVLLVIGYFGYLGVTLLQELL